jgi:hypothetical protein
MARPGARVPEIQHAAEALAAVISAIVRLAADDDDSRSFVEQTVLEMSLSQIDAQRSWFLPQGWEPDPAAVPSIEEALGLSAPGSR